MIRFYLTVLNVYLTVLNVYLTVLNVYLTVLNVYLTVLNVYLTVSNMLKMKVYTFPSYWSTDSTKEYKEYIFIYGDNDIKKGAGGQAIIRYEPNAMGIPTKKYPSSSEYAFYNDNEYEENCEKITLSINAIKEKLYNTSKYLGIMLPKDGIGTGLADLWNKAPKTYIFLVESINALSKALLNT
jgi:hypothetical protein